MNINNGKLISIDEIIILAQRMGVDFGNGDPRHRLRYYTKIGLLPHAQRKCFNNHSPEGAYEESVIDLLVKIDKKIKSGKSIQTIKREAGEEREKNEKAEEELFEARFAPSLPIGSRMLHISGGVPPAIDIYTESQAKISEIKEEFKEEFAFEEKPKIFLKHSKLNSVFKILLLFLISGSVIFIVKAKPDIKNLIGYFPAALNKFEKLAQVPSPPLDKEPVAAIGESDYEPYLTINAETLINGSLSVKEKITVPLLGLTSGEFEGRMTAADLTADQNYIFPDQSGMVCLATGNCVGLGGELTSTGAAANRLARFISANRVGNASISDFYNQGVAITIDTNGNVGIGTAFPRYDLDVQGAIQATGDICTDLNGGKCLSRLSGGGGGFYIAPAAVSGISGSGSTNYLPIWTSSTGLGNSIISQSGSVVDVAGTVKMTGFQLGTSTTLGYVLMADGSGVGAWQSLPTSTLPTAFAGYTLRGDGTNWIGSSFLYNTGSAIGIGTTSPNAVLTVNGDGYFLGPLTLATSTVPQLVLKYDDGNYLRFSIDGTQSTILASKTMVLNSLTGEISLGNDVNVLNATSATVWGETFVSAANDATVRKSGELILRSSVPVFKFPVPAQTTSTAAVDVTKLISTSTLNSALPSSLAGTTRYFAFLLNFSDDISTSASSTWTIDLTAGTDTEFYFAGQNLSLAELEEGISHLSGYFSPPAENWELKVSVPAGKTIRVFNIFLLVFDRVN